MKKPLVILTGPTAVGKTALSISLAKAINGEIISADSMQVYKGMDIGTAKIRPEEMQNVTHYLIDILNPDEAFNVVDFKRLADDAIEKIYAKNKIPIIAGGTGFYIQALLYAIDFDTSEVPSEDYRISLEKLAEEQGNQYLHDLLNQVDPEAAQAIHPNNRKRVIRALEYYKQTGQKISVHNNESRQKESPYQFVYFVLNQERSILYQRIEDRIDAMLKDGLLEEVRYLKEEKGYTKDMISMQGLGYKEFFPYLEGEISLEEAVTILKRDTRHFAKRQLTWFRREKEVIWIDKQLYTSEDEILSAMLAILKEKNIIE